MDFTWGSARNEVPLQSLGITVPSEFQSVQSCHSVLVTGFAGAGISSTANAIVGDPAAFPVSDGLDIQTKEVSSHVSDWFGEEVKVSDRMPVQVIESPGLGGEDDVDSLEKIADALRK